MFTQKAAPRWWYGALLLAGAAVVVTPLALKGQLPIEPIHDTGASVQPSFEGWWQEKDGSYRIMLGYFNRNSKETPDIPVGPNNHIDPGGPDQGQPTHFLTRRHWGMFVVKVPKDFGTDKKLTWTLVSGGKTLTVPMSLNVLWNMNPYADAQDVTPPTIGFEQGGPTHLGPDPLVVTKTAKVGEPLDLTVWAADDAKNQLGGGGAGRGAAGRGGAAAGGRGGAGRGGAGAAAGGGQPTADQIAAAAAAAGVDADTIAQFIPRGVVSVNWSKFRGPGEVTFANPRPQVTKVENATWPREAPYIGKASTTATFTEPGEYTLLSVVTNGTGEGGGGFLCCWTNGEVKVTVK